MGVAGNREDIKRRVHEATDLVTLIGEHVALRARGREMVGLCPFHDDKSPSLNVSPAKGIYKCFACNAGGDAFSFVMAYHKMSFPEALAFLAERANIELPKFTRGGSSESGAASPRQRVLQVNKHALDYFRRTLRDATRGKIARHYIAQRAINDAMVEAFQLGAAPDAWDALYVEAGTKRWDIDAMTQAGLIAQRDRGEGCFDRLRHRLIFPILDNVGRPIAFGGRILPESTRDEKSDAKYLNSPESPAFNKSATLYGLHAAQKPIIDSHTAIIVEGYIDVIAAHQAGVCNVVATLGTALTPEHAKVLRRYCEKVILVFDGDEAGQKAADRALGVFFAESIDIAIATLPGGQDPADLLLKPGGREVWDAAIAQADDAMTYQFKRIRKGFDNADTLAGRQRIAEDYLRKLVDLGIDRLDRQRYGLVFAQVAQLLGMNPGAVNDYLAKLAPRPRHTPSPDAPADSSPPGKQALAERHLVGAVLCRPELFDIELSDGRPLSESIVPDDFTDPQTREVFLALSDWIHDHAELTPSHFRDVFPNEDLHKLALDLQLEIDRLTDSDPDRIHEQVYQNAMAILREREEREYQSRRLEIARPDANDAAPADEARKLNGIFQHLNSHRNARRVPRVVGHE